MFDHSGASLIMPFCSQNRKYLQELSKRNCEIIALIEKSISVASLDETWPSSYSEVCMQNMGGDLHSRWADKSCSMTLFRSGKVGCIGEVCHFSGY